MLAVNESGLDAILAIQLLVAWAGEARCEPRRLGWWDTDLIDEAGGGDLLKRLAPRTHAWAALEAVREAARRVDAEGRGRLGDPDQLRTLFFLGFDLDERLADRLAAHRRAGVTPADALPLALPLGSELDRDRLIEALTAQQRATFAPVPPIGRRLKGKAPEEPAALVQALGSALVPLAEQYPLPHHRVEG